MPPEDPLPESPPALPAARVAPSMPPCAGTPEATGLWSTLRSAVRGAEGQDFTAGPLGHAILLLAVPMVLEMAMESIFAVADVFWVSRLGADAVATVGLTETMMTLVYSVAMGLSIGVTATVARRIGERQPDQAAEVAVQGIALGGLLSLLLGVAGVAFAGHLLTLMGGTPSIGAVGTSYTRVLLGGSAVVMLLYLINAVFRGAGDAAIAMRVLWLANGINIVLGPLLIFGVGPFPRLGVTGAAVATTVGRGIGVVYQLWNLRRSRRVKVARRHLRLVPALMLRLLKLSGAAMLQVLIGMASWIGLVRVVADFGSSALAGYTIGIRLIIFALLPSAGVSNAAATLVGQALGAGKPERAEQAVWRAGLYNLCFLTALGLLLLVGAGPLVALFSRDPAVAEVATRCLRIIALGFPFYAYGMVFGQSFDGAGDTWTPTWLNFSCFWAFEIPLAWALATHAGLGPSGAFAAVTAAFSAYAMLSAWMFRRGRWKSRMV